MLELEYEGVSKSFRTESRMKCTLKFGITRCCPFQSTHLPSSCKWSSVSATAGSTGGTDFLESRVACRTVSNCSWISGHPGNDALLASISFSERSENRKVPNQDSKEGGETVMISAAKNRYTDKAVCAGYPPHVKVVRMLCHIPYERSNVLAVSLMVFRRSSMKILRTFSTFSSVRPVEGRPERSESLTEKFSHVWIERTTQKFVFCP
jgi:hypothetical protein